MIAETARYRELQEQKIGLLEALCDALIAAKTAIVSCKIQELEESLNAQWSLCAQLQAADAELRGVQLQEAEAGRDVAPDEELKPRWQRVIERVQQLNKEQKALTERSRRTVNILLNALQTFEGNYAAAALKQASSGVATQEHI